MGPRPPKRNEGRPHQSHLSRQLVNLFFLLTFASKMTSSGARRNRGQKMCELLILFGHCCLNPLVVIIFVIDIINILTFSPQAAGTLYAWLCSRACAFVYSTGVCVCVYMTLILLLCVLQNVVLEVSTLSTTLPGLLFGKSVLHTSRRIATTFSHSQQKIYFLKMSTIDTAMTRGMTCIICIIFRCTELHPSTFSTASRS